MRNAIDFSAFTELRHHLPFLNFSVKYVVEGCEHYTINGYRHSVPAGSYLLVNHHAEGFVEIESRTSVKGICISLAPELLMEAVASHLEPGAAQPDWSLDRFFTTPDFFENQYSAERTSAGRMLRHLEQTMGNWPRTSPWRDFSPLTREICFDLAGRIVADHVPVIRQLQAIRSVKPATRKDLLRRVTRGREYLDAHFSEPLDIATVARAACLSEYHFFRLFRAVYGLSPYRYLLQRRLETAAARLSDGRTTVAGVAADCGFADVQAFSKAFKSRMGVSPGAFARTKAVF